MVNASLRGQKYWPCLASEASVRVQYLAGPTLIAVALLAAIFLAQVRIGPQPDSATAVAQQDRNPSPSSSVR
jgi:hypothetical protein